MNLQSCVLLAVILLLAAVACLYLHRKKKDGCMGCCGGNCGCCKKDYKKK